MGNTEQHRPRLDGYWKLDGTVNMSGAYIVLPATVFVRVPIRLGNGILDELAPGIRTDMRDEFKTRVKLSDAIKLDAAERLPGFGRVNDRLDIGIRRYMYINGRYTLNGYIKLNGGLLQAA